MKKLLAILTVSFMLACGARNIGSTHGTGAPGPGEVRIEVENQNWQLAKIYLVSAGTTAAYRIGSVEGMTTQVLTPRIHAPRFLLQVRLLTERNRIAWQSQEWSSAEDCVQVRIRSYVPNTYTLPC